MEVTRTRAFLFPRLLLLLLLLSLSPVAFSRHHRTSSPPAATLDVSDALQKATQVLTFDQESRQSLFHWDAGKQSSSSGLSLLLHSRDSLHRGTHKDYRSLTLDRLRRDAARVEALTTRVDLAVDGVKRADLEPLLEGTILSKEDVSRGDGAMEGPVVSGASRGSGEYFSRVSIGQPPKSMYMVLDTGSDITWVQCQPCIDCYQQTDPIFNPSASSSYSAASCHSTQCKSLDVSLCRNSTCLYQVSYGDGSYTVGDFAKESVTFGGHDSVPNVAFGCGHVNKGLFVGAAGLLGLGGGPLSFPSQLSAKSFSYCLVDRDASYSSTIEFNRNGHGSSSSSDTVTAPLLKNKKVNTFYYVGLTGISVGGHMLSIPKSEFAMDESGRGGVIIDSGTAVTRLNPSVYSALRNAFVAGTTGLPSAAGVALFDTCYNLSSRTSVDVPTVAFHFPGGSKLLLPAKNYVIPVGSSSVFCLAFAPTSSANRLSIIGNVQQQGTRVSFDLGNGEVRFSSNKC